MMTTRVANLLFAQAYGFESLRPFRIVFQEVQQSRDLQWTVALPTAFGRFPECPTCTHQSSSLAPKVWQLNQVKRNLNTFSNIFFLLCIYLD